MSLNEWSDWSDCPSLNKHLHKVCFEAGLVYVLGIVYIFMRTSIWKTGMCSPDLIKQWENHAFCAICPFIYLLSCSMIVTEVVFNPTYGWQDTLKTEDACQWRAITHSRTWEIWSSVCGNQRNICTQWENMQILHRKAPTWTVNPLHGRRHSSTVS